jgi:hypothetical protein
MLRRKGEMHSAVTRYFNVSIRKYVVDRHEIEMMGRAAFEAKLHKDLPGYADEGRDHADRLIFTWKVLHLSMDEYAWAFESDAFEPHDAGPRDKILYSALAREAAATEIRGMKADLVLIDEVADLDTSVWSKALAKDLSAKIDRALYDSFPSPVASSTITSTSTLTAEKLFKDMDALMEKIPFVRSRSHLDDYSFPVPTLDKPPSSAWGKFTFVPMETKKVIVTDSST